MNLDELGESKWFDPYKTTRGAVALRYLRNHLRKKIPTPKLTISGKFAFAKFYDKVNKPIAGNDNFEISNRLIQSRIYLVFSFLVKNNIIILNCLRYLTTLTIGFFCLGKTIFELVENHGNIYDSERGKNTAKI